MIDQPKEMEAMMTHDILPLEGHCITIHEGRLWVRYAVEGKVALNVFLDPTVIYRCLK